MRFKLLITLPCFQKDIKRIRGELNIPENGIGESANSHRSWYEKEIIQKGDKLSNSKRFLEELKKISILRQKDYPEYIKRNWILHDQMPVNKLNNRLEELINKYKLPANFKDALFGGLRMYIIKNSIIPPTNNWVIEQNTREKGTAVKWISIKTYASLSQKELRDAIDTLKHTQKYYFPRSLTVDTRAKPQFDRDLEIFKELVLERAKKPVRRKKYSGYLSYLKPKNLKEKRQLEKLHPHCVETAFDETISREVAKKLKMTPEAVKQVLTKMRARIKEFFGEEHLER